MAKRPLSTTVDATHYNPLLNTCVLTREDFLHELTGLTVAFENAEAETIPAHSGVVSSPRHHRLRATVIRKGSLYASDLFGLAVFLGGPLGVKWVGMPVAPMTTREPNECNLDESAIHFASNVNADSSTIGDLSNREGYP